MSKPKNSVPNRSHVERLVDIMFSDAAVPQASMGKMRLWLVEPDKAEEKSDALYKKFLEIFKFDPAPVHAPAMWPELARRLGMNESPVPATRDCLAGCESDTAEEMAVGNVENNAVMTSSVSEGAVSEDEAERAQTRRRLTFGRTIRRVAAVLLPILAIGGAALWMLGRGDRGGLVEIAVSPEAGQTIILPDGSRVEAEPGAKLSYNERSFTRHRLVTLSGDALFEVLSATAADGSRTSFTVEAEHLTVDVLGTVFRLDRRGENGGDETTEVSLYKGSVGVTIETADRMETLSAGERLRVNTLTGECSTEIIPASEMAAQGAMPLLVFNGATLGDVITALEMNHSVAFDLAAGIDTAAGRYDADFEELPLEDILAMLSKIDGGLSFELRGDRVEVNRK